MSKKKREENTLKFLSNQKSCQLSPLNKWKKSKVMVNILDLDDVINNHSEFEPNQIRTYSFQLKVLYIAVNLICGQNQSSNIMLSLTFIIFMVSEKITMVKFLTGQTFKQLAICLAKHWSLNTLKKIHASQKVDRFKVLNVFFLHVLELTYLVWKPN